MIEKDIKALDIVTSGINTIVIKYLPPQNNKANKGDLEKLLKQMEFITSWTETLTKSVKKALENNGNHID